MFYLGLGACGGGGGGGGGRPDFGGGSNEFSAQAGLAQVSVAPAYAAGITGRSVAVAVTDSGIDGRPFKQGNGTCAWLK